MTLLRDHIHEQTAILSRRANAFIEQICETLMRYPFKRGKLILYTQSSHFASQHIDNGYFSVTYNGINGHLMINVLPEHNNQALRNYFEATGDKFFRVINSLEELEEFCETAKFIGGFGDEH